MQHTLLCKRVVGNCFFRGHDKVNQWVQYLLHLHKDLSVSPRDPWRSQHNTSGLNCSTSRRRWKEKDRSLELVGKLAQLTGELHIQWVALFKEMITCVDLKHLHMCFHTQICTHTKIKRMYTTHKCPQIYIFPYVWHLKFKNLLMSLPMFDTTTIFLSWNSLP